ncbi:MAG: permease, partial [Candidatus Acidiferrales bacterium]
LGLAGNFALGALMTLGIGLYAPCLILVSLLGMSPAAAFPIMMGSCAFLMPVGGIRFIKEGSYAPWTAVVMSIAGIPAVLIAAKIVGSMDLTTLRWLVLVVVLYTAALMLRSAFTEKPSAPATQAKGAAIAD